MKSKIINVFIITLFILGHESNIIAQEASQTGVKFSKDLISNFSNAQFLKEEEAFNRAHGQEVKIKVETYHELGIALYQNDDLDNAIIVFQKSALVHPNNDSVLNIISRLYEQQNNIEKAITYNEQAIQVSINQAAGNEGYYQGEIVRLNRRPANPGIDILFEDGKYSFKKDNKQLITDIIVQSEKELRKLLPSIPEDIRLIVTIIDREINIVGGVTGRADTHNPAGEIIIEISNVFPGGIVAASKRALRATLYHEFHHLSRGWTIKNNKYGPGISIAAVNEGLAVVFSELYTGVIEEGNSYPEEVNTWVEEILKLPKNASYYKWVSGEHPDGRTAIGYRVGNYIIHEALSNSGKSILELSKLSPEEIITLAGF